MDITHPVYLFFAERVIRKLMECTAHRNCVIGFQVDNETKNTGLKGSLMKGRKDTSADWVMELIETEGAHMGTERRF